MNIGSYSVEDYMHLVKSFHGNIAPGLIIGGFMVDLAMKEFSRRGPFRRHQRDSDLSSGCHSAPHTLHHRQRLAQDLELRPLCPVPVRQILR